MDKGVSIIDQFHAVWPLIMKAQWAFVALELSILVVSWGLAWLFFKHMLSSKQERIDNLTEKNADLKEKIKEKEKKSQETSKNIAENKTFSDWLKQEYEPIAVTNKSFKNQIVDIDGKLFVGCEFINVTIRYNGGMPFGFQDCFFPGTIKFDSLKPEQIALLNLYLGLDDQFKDLKSMVVLSE